MSEPRPMNCWVQARKNGPWHQAQRFLLMPTATLCCSGRVVRAVAAHEAQWRPVNEFGSQCQQAACQRDVAP